MNECGITIDELYEISFKEYLDLNSHLKGEPTEIQQNTYSHYENKRKNKILIIKEKREAIIKEEENKENQENSKSKDQEELATIVRKEQEQLEKLIKKQEEDFKHMIDYQIEMEENRQKSEISCCE